MKLASIDNGSPDGQLVVISKDTSQMCRVHGSAGTMAACLADWQSVLPVLQDISNTLNNGTCEQAEPVAGAGFLAPVPRTYQWLDGSLFMNHGHLMQKAFNLDPIEDADKYPLIYQGAGDAFTGCNDTIALYNPAHGVDFEGEFGVLTTDVPVGATPDEAMQAIKLVVQLNDISYRGLAPREMKTGFGFVQAKGETAFAPFAVTPDELGDSWADGRIHLTLNINRNDEWFGSPSGSEMHFGFHELIAHAATTRPIKAGTVFGSGTVSNANPEAGQACIAELRAKELIRHGKPQTPFLSEGETVHMVCRDKQGQPLFGEINQTVKGG